MIGQPVLFEYRTGCEWHPSNQTLQCPVVTIRCYPWSAGSYNRDVLQSYWTSDGLPLYCNQPTGEKTHTQTNNVKDLPRSGRPRVTSDRDHVVLNTTPNVIVDVGLPTVDWFQTVSNCSCWQTSIGQSVLFEYRTGCEWHPSNQTLQCPKLLDVRWATTIL
jgi:hypothetical protein